MNVEDNINILGNFCGLRDVDRLSADAIQRKYGFIQADAMVLFGGSVIEGGDVLAKAMQEKITKNISLSAALDIRQRHSGRECTRSTQT